MGLIKEFKDFAMRGNVIDMAVGIVIGAAFGRIVSSFVGDIVMPLVGRVTGGVDLSEYRIPLKDAVLAADGTETAAAVYVNVGTFANVVIDFLIVAFAIFVVIKAMNAAKKKEAAPPPAAPKPSNEEVLLTQIRDALIRGGR